jgi:hypothetical protein
MPVTKLWFSRSSAASKDSFNWPLVFTMNQGHSRPGRRRQAASCCHGHGLTAPDFTGAHDLGSGAGGPSPLDQKPSFALV